MIYFIGKKQLFQSEIIIESSIKECLDYFKDKTLIQIDTETEGGKDNIPNPYQHKVLSFQIGDKQNQWVIDTQLYSIKLFKDILEDTTKVKILANAFFDLRFFYYYEIFTKNIFDIFLAEMLLTLGKEMEKGYRSLESMSQRYCGVKLNKDIRGQIHYRGLDTTVIKYAAEDVQWMEDIRDYQLQQLIERNQLEAINLENKYCISLARTAYIGYKVDKNKWLEVWESNKKKLSGIKQQLNDYILKDPKLIKFTNKAFSLLLFEDAAKCDINWKSSQQVVPLFQQLGIKTLIIDKKTGSNKDSVDIKLLRRQIKNCDLIPIYIRYKELEKEIDTYGQEFIQKSLNPITGRIHSQYFQLLDTGRISSSHPNLQNIPANDEKGEVHPFRQCFIPEKGNVLIVADYSQQEPRLTAEYSQDPYLIDFILNGDGDSHSLVSTAISYHLLGEEIKVSKKNNPIVPRYKAKIRDIGKTINLGLDYGKTAFSIKEDLDCTQEEAQTLIDAIKEKTPMKEKYFKEQFKFVWKNGFTVVDEYTKRRSYFYAYDELMAIHQIPYEERNRIQISRYFRLKGEMERFSRNYRIQGSGGSMTKLASILFDEAIEAKGWRDRAFIVNSIHDEENVECNEEIKEEVKQILEDSMIKAGEYFCKTIPMKVEGIIGDNWGCKS